MPPGGPPQQRALSRQAQPLPPSSQPHLSQQPASAQLLSNQQPQPAGLGAGESQQPQSGARPTHGHGPRGPAHSGAQTGSHIATAPSAWPARGSPTGAGYAPASGLPGVPSTRAQTSASQASASASSSGGATALQAKVAGPVGGVQRGTPECLGQAEQRGPVVPGSGPQVRLRPPCGPGHSASIQVPPAATGAPQAGRLPGRGGAGHVAVGGQARQTCGPPGPPGPVVPGPSGCRRHPQGTSAGPGPAPSGSNMR